MIGTLQAYLAQGGVVAGPLVVLGLVLWYLLGLRWLDLRRGIPRGSLDRQLRGLVDGEDPPPGAGVLARGLRTAAVGLRGLAQAKAARDSLEVQAMQLDRFKRAIRVLVAVAPLLGLLGTVTGMIETFASLSDMTLFARSGGVAGGISEALVSTQLGLVVAIPGLLAGRVLDQREEELRLGLGQMSEHLAVATGEEVA